MGNTNGAAVCSQYLGEDVCLVNQPLSYLLVVSVPPNVQFPTGRNAIVLPGPSSSNDVTIPSPVAQFGSYLADGDAEGQQGVNRYTYVTCPPQITTGCSTALPSDVTYFPQYGPVDATSVGLPLPPIVATSSLMPSSDPSYPTSFSPGQQPPLGWSATLPAVSGTFGSGTFGYVRQVTVEAPFDAAFPPDLSPVPTPLMSPPNDDRLKVTQQNVFVTSLASATSLAGWKMFLREEATGRHVSNVFTIPGPTLMEAPSVFTAQLAPMSGWELVVQPADPTMPLFINELLGNPLGSPTSPLTYPTLAGHVQVQGHVLAPTGGPTASASVVFQSDSIDVMGGALSTTNLSYQTTVLADASGHYSVLLPAGQYDATITPADPSLPKVTLPRLTAKPTVDLPVSVSATVNGTCIVSDGRPLSAAEVDLTPAVTLGTQNPPNPWTWPRPTQVVTDSKGGFSLSVDPGTYDVTVKPAEGSRLPWIVQTSHTVTSGMPLTLSDCTVPAPVLERVRLLDAAMFGSQVQNAVVRVYAQHATTAMDATFHQIGQGFTDLGGNTDLFLTNLP